MEIAGLKAVASLTGAGKDHCCGFPPNGSLSLNNLVKLGGVSERNDAKGSFVVALLPAAMAALCKQWSILGNCQSIAAHIFRRAASSSLVNSASMK